MSEKSTTTLKMSPELKRRIVRLAKKSGRTPHAFMLEALERQATREEQMEAFVREAIETDRAIDAGAEVYAADDVHAWLERVAEGHKPKRPKPWRG
jgi:predicted transcriptional regulator